MPNKKESPKTVSLQKPRGMRDLLGDTFYKYNGFFEKAEEIALYYGFTPIETPLLEREGIFTSGVGENTDIIEKEVYSLRIKGGEKLILRPEGTAPIMRAYIEYGMHTKPQPVMLYYYGPFFRHDKPQRGRYRQFYQFGLEVLGTPRSMADAIVIKLMYTILEEMQFKNLCLLLNSIGDNECRPQYIKELTTYYRGHLNTICTDCRQRMKTNPLRLLDCKDEKCQPIKAEAPEMMAFLCNGCKTHFREVLEYLDTMNIQYRIDHTLVRGLDYYTRTVFEIIEDEDCEEEEVEKKEEKEVKDEEKKEEPKEEVKKEKPEPLSLGSGGRYDYLAQKLGSKREVPGIGMAMGVDRIIENAPIKSLTPRIVKKPKLFFIQIGFEAKLKSFAVIEILRKAKISLKHSLSRDRLSVQLALAEKTEIPYTIIIGQKEALDGTVIVRNMKTRSQEKVKVEELADTLKKKKI